MTETVAATEKPQPCISAKCGECERYHDLLDYFLDDLWPELRKKGCRTRSELRIFWFIFVKLCFRGQTPFHVCPEEAAEMRALQKDGYSMADLAFIFDRSTATIHETLKKLENSLGESQANEQ